LAFSDDRVHADPAAQRRVRLRPNGFIVQIGIGRRAPLQIREPVGLTRQRRRTQAKEHLTVTGMGWHGAEMNDLGVRAGRHCRQHSLELRVRQKLGFVDEQPVVSTAAEN
jgi:hypothetical protein